MELDGHNYAQNEARLIQDIRDAELVSFDCEFTGLLKDKKIKYLDEVKEHYQNLKFFSRGGQLLQLGICPFIWNKGTEKYEARPYSIYVAPGNELAWWRKAFSVQPSGIDFLAKNNFDFNRSFKDGVTYLSRKEKDSLMEVIKKEVEDCDVGPQEEPEEAHISDFWRRKDLDEVHRIMEPIKLWYDAAEMYSEVKLDGELRYKGRKILFTEELRRKYGKSMIWYKKFGKNGVLTGRKVPEVEYDSQFEKSRIDQLERSNGISNVMEEIIRKKVAFVGHNCLLDLVLMYDAFIGPLPVEYVDFKKSIRVLFPRILDTKYISHRLGIMDNGLEVLYTGLKERANIELENAIMEQAHDAGYDAFMTGVCEIQLLQQAGSPEETYMNKLNVVGSIHTLVLENDEYDLDETLAANMWIIAVSEDEEHGVRSDLQKKLEEYGEIAKKYGYGKDLIVVCTRYWDNYTRNDIEMALEQMGLSFEPFSLDYFRRKRSPIENPGTGMCTIV